MRLFLLTLASLLLAAYAASAQTAGTPIPSVRGSATVADRTDWEKFLARHDLIWNTIPARWPEGAFVGNGLVGTMVFKDGPEALHFSVGRSDVVDRGARVGIGKFALETAGAVEGGTAHLDLWNAEASGTIRTDKGEIAWRSYAHAERPVIVVEIDAVGGEAVSALRWQPAEAVNPRKVKNKEEIKDADRNPAPVLRSVGAVSVCEQPLKVGGGHTTAWVEQRAANDKRILYIAVGKADSLEKATAEAVRTVEGARDAGTDTLRRSHRAWWHAFYPQSFLSIPDTRLESFYWIQIYKMASATRADRPMIDLMGPWFKLTSWPAIWWNLNSQLTYWPVYTGNRLELGESLTRTLDKGAENLIANAPEAFRADSSALGRATSYDMRAGVGEERGNLVWALHNYWLQYRYSMDDAMLREKLYPLLRRAVNYYLHILEEGSDGRYHLPVSISPEYPKKAADTNYDLALLRWGCTTLLRASERLNIDDPLKPRWKEVLEKLTPYPQDETGLMIGRDVPLSESHRHYSHLLMVYPLYLMSPDNPKDRPLIEKSLAHWSGFEGALAGYSFSGAASLSALLGRGDDSAKFLNSLVDRYVRPNTMYLEGDNPVIETPLSGAAALHDMMLQSGTGVIKVFPAAPTSWPDIAFRNLRAEGAFLVTASRRGGRTQFVRITSLAGESCRVRTDLAGPIEAVGSRPPVVRAEPGGSLAIDLRKGESVLLRTKGSKVAPEIAPVAAGEDRVNLFGSPKRPPIRQQADGSFLLKASLALLHGQELFYQNKPEGESIGHWVDLKEYVSWPLVVSRPGRFKVFVTSSRPGDQPGLEFAVAVGDSRVVGRVQGSGDWDRFKEYPLGEITIPAAGKAELTVRSVPTTGGALMNLQAVRLEPVR